MTESPASSDELLARMRRLHPKVIDLSLGRLRRLLGQLGDPHRAMAPVIHVAGTNGKGSVCAMLHAGLKRAGLRAQLYSSPHLVRFHERIRLAGGMVSEQKLADALLLCEKANGGAPITFFEITTAAAFWLFSQEKADYAIIETGLGGRRDATNVFSAPALTAISAISLDHTQYLGESIEKIAFEKAGILKRNTPCHLAAQGEAAKGVVMERAAALRAPLFMEGRDWTICRDEEGLVYEDTRHSLRLPHPILAGYHQTHNAGLAIAMLSALGMGEAAFGGALREAEWPARMQRLTGGVLAGMLPPGWEIWLDGGHNRGAGEALARFAGDLRRRDGKPLTLICAMLSGKDIAGFLRPFAPYVDAFRAVPMPDSEAVSGEAAAPPEVIAEQARSVGIAPRISAGVIDAVSDSLPEGTGPGRILITGSLYLAGHVLRDLA